MLLKMKNILSLVLVIFFCQLLEAQNVGIGTNTPNANAALEIKSNTKGLLMPRLSAGGRTGMTNVPKGMMVYDSTYSSFYYHDGNKWRSISELNNDSLLKNYMGSPQVTASMSNNATIGALSGILYDNGGPAGNYSNGASDSYMVTSANNDSIVGYKVVVEQMNVEINDTLAIYVADDPAHAVFITGNSTGTYYFSSGSNLGFMFVSNGSVNAPGFKIVWSVLTTSNAAAEAPPSYGWYFSPPKIAVRGGVSPNNHWVADSLGKFSFAYGNNARAKGYGSVALGSFVSASGQHAVAMGATSTASGQNSLSAGYASSATANYAIAIGASTIASAISATSIGNNTKALGLYSLAMGRGTTASGDNSIAMGLDSDATSTGSISIGDDCSAGGAYAVAIGNGNTASGSSAVAMGSGSLAAGSISTAIGRSTTAPSYCSFVIGSYNQHVGQNLGAVWDPSEPLFIIGNGISGGSPSNAMVVLKSGRTGMGTNTPVTTLHIESGTDANLLDNSGYLVLGNIGGSNLVFDNNEIMARNNGANNTLFLQNSGGALETGGTAAKPGGGSWAATSDARLKQNVKPYNDGLQQLMKINPVYYQYNKLSGYDTEKQYIGVLAQDIKEVAPYMVGTYKKNDAEYYNVDNTAMTYMLINAVKEQQKQIATQQQQIEELKALVQGLLKK
jgi:hypothetical protein